MGEGPPRPGAPPGAHPPPARRQRPRPSAGADGPSFAGTGPGRNGEPLTPRRPARAVRFANCRLGLGTHAGLPQGPSVSYGLARRTPAPGPGRREWLLPRGPAGGRTLPSPSSWEKPATRPRASRTEATCRDASALPRASTTTSAADGACRGSVRWPLEGLEEWPFFLFVHTYDVHCPYDPTAPLPAALPSPLHGPARLRGYLREALLQRPSLTEEEREHVRIHYDAGVRSADDTLGDFLDWLEAAGRLEDTAIIVTSDGESLGAVLRGPRGALRQSASRAARRLRPGPGSRRWSMRRSRVWTWEPRIPPPDGRTASTENLRASHGRLRPVTPPAVRGWPRWR